MHIEHEAADKIAAAILVLATEGQSHRRWDIIEEFFWTLADMAEQREERPNVREN